MITRPHYCRNRNGKIARLPEPIRERINNMLMDGFRYRAIISALAQPGSPPLPYPISEMNLSNWFKGGYKDWCRLQERLELNPPLRPRDLLQLLRNQSALRKPPTPAAPAPIRT